MKIYKIAQESQFYTWFSDELLRMTNNYKTKIPNYITNDSISEISEKFTELSKEELNKLKLEDLYIINYITGGSHNLGTLYDRSTIERLSGVDREWINRSVQNFPDILNKYITPILIETINTNVTNYGSIPESYRTILPKEIKEKVIKYYDNAILNKLTSYREIPEDLRSQLPQQTKNYIINTFAEAFKDANGKGLEIIPQDIRDAVSETIEKTKN